MKWLFLEAVVFLLVAILLEITWWQGLLLGFSYVTYYWLERSREDELGRESY